MMFPLLVAAIAATALPFYAHPDAGAQLVGVSVVIRAGTARETPQQNGLAALTAQTVLFTRIDGVRLADRIAAEGGSIDYAVGPGIVRFALEALPGAFPSVTGELAAALAHPETTGATVGAARAALGDRIDDNERNPVTVGLEMLDSSYYAGTAGAPPYGTRASLANLGAADVAAFASAHYLRGNAFATATGLVDASATDATAALLAALPAGSEPPPALAVRPFGEQPKHIVAQREIGVPFVLVGFAAPAMDDPDFAAMLVVRSLLDDIAARQSSATLEPFDRGIDVVYDYDVKPATFTVAINGGQLDPNAGLTVLQAVVKTATVKLGNDVIERYKETARGDWALEAMSLNERAWQIGAAVNEGADPALADGVDAAIAKVTAADVQRLVKTYLQRYTVALVLPRTRS